jgi:chitinase
MRRSRALVVVLGALALGTLALVEGTSGSATAAPAAPHGPTAAQVLRASPYEYIGWGNPPRVRRVMRATGVHAFTLAFLLSDGTCNAGRSRR